MFTSEYVVASFEDVRRFFDRPLPASSAFRAKGAMRQRSGTVASLPIEWAEPAAGWRPAELRIIRVQSGNSPLTEILLVGPSQGDPVAARHLLATLGARVEEMVRLDSPHRAGVS